ncbi:MFS transporter [Schaalia turicensis]|uniref:MFS transporter n=1 Tax=Schaalia turicensis TaxID=131111 RepID=UPI00367A8A49
MTASSPSPGSPGAKSGASAAAASGKSSGSTAAREATLNIAVRKARRRLVPFMMLLYVLAFLDRSNIGYAQQEYMLDTGIGEATFALGAGIFFVLYAFLGAPANLMMRKIGAQKWIGSIAVAWGLVSACMAFADTPAKFLTIRLLLGVVEAGFFPGMIYLASIFFPAKPRAYVMGLFYLGAPLALALGSPLSGALLQMHGFLGFPGWFWMFLIEGLLAAVVGCLAFFYFDDGPRSAKFLTPEERIVLAEAVEGEDSGSGVKSTLKDAFTNARVWTLAMAYFAIQVAVYGVVFYIPRRWRACWANRWASRCPSSSPFRGWFPSSARGGSPRTPPPRIGSESGRPGCCWRPGWPSGFRRTPPRFSRSRRCASWPPA